MFFFPAESYIMCRLLETHGYFIDEAQIACEIYRGKWFIHLASILLLRMVYYLKSNTSCETQSYLVQLWLIIDRLPGLSCSQRDLPSAQQTAVSHPRAQDHHACGWGVGCRLCFDQSYSCCLTRKLHETKCSRTFHFHYIHETQNVFLSEKSVGRTQMVRVLACCPYIHIIQLINAPWEWVDVNVTPDKRLVFCQKERVSNYFLSGWLIVRI